MWLTSGAGPCAGQRGHARVTEQIGHAAPAGWPLGSALPLAQCEACSGKNADMAEGGEAAEIIDPSCLHGPGFAERRVGEAPAAHALFILCRR